MPGSVQSVERAVGALRALAVAPGPLALGELAALLDLPKTTTHGLVRTLVGVGLVSQDPTSGKYAAVPDALASGAPPDPHWLRSRAMNWTDRLAARTGQAVELGVVGHVEGRRNDETGSTGHVELAQHVFRPDDSTQRLRTGEHQPLHATALGLVLLAESPTAPAARTLTLTAYTATTVGDADLLDAQLADVRRAGHALESGTHRPDVAAIAVPVRDAGPTAGRQVVAALAVVGRPEHLLDAARCPLPGLLVHLHEAAQAVCDALADDP